MLLIKCKISIILTALVATTFLSGCSKEVPKCSDDDTLKMAKQLLANTMTDTWNIQDPNHKIDPKWLVDKIDFKYPVADNLNNDIKKYTCSADVNVANVLEFPLQYTSQLDDINHHLVSIIPIAINNNVLMGMAHIYVDSSASKASSSTSDTSSTTSIATSINNTQNQSSVPNSNPDSSQSEPELGLIAAIKPNTDNSDRMGDSGKAIRTYINAGYLNIKPNTRTDYTDHWLLKHSAPFLGNDLVMIDEEYMTKFIGCCVNPGLILTIRTTPAGLNSLRNFAKANKCSLDENIKIDQVFSDATIQGAPKMDGSFASLSCRQSDLAQDISPDPVAQ
jgi:hypothetical protein